MAPRPDLNGLRLQQYGEPHVFLIDQGLRRWIPSAAVMARLFTFGAEVAYNYQPSPGVILDLHVNQIDAGIQLPDYCAMFQTSDCPQVFLRDQDADGKPIKRWITNPETMERFQFDWHKINHWDEKLEDLGLPDGPNISWP
jgi:hypothetical protein